MGEETYFQKALSNFTFEMASAGAIRHLADLGYTVNQIMEKLDFPTPYERVQKTVWEHLVNEKVILLEEPGSGNGLEKVRYVTDYGKYGKKSFRKVVEKVEDAGTIQWKTFQLKDVVVDNYNSAGINNLLCNDIEDDNQKAVLLKQNHFMMILEEKVSENGWKEAYISCDFGLQMYREPEKYMERLQLLNERQREYILGLPWERKLVYHRMSQDMIEIIARLYGTDQYHGFGYFMKTQEKIEI